jgi:hypothetical protein
MTEQARCAAHLRSGERCRSVAFEGEFCAYHDRVASEVGEDAVRAGQHVRRRRQDSTLARVVAEPTPEPPEPAAQNGSDDVGVVTPSEVRPRLAAAAAANLPDLERVLLDAATGATREAWTTITCKHCERQGRYEVVIPDYRVRLDAVEKLLQQGLGRAREAQESSTSEVPAVAADVMKLPWQDLQRFAATYLLDDLVGLQRRGAEALLRERLAALSDGERHALREALDATAA